ncbi:hypothetical protein HYT18_02505 [Candidatus Microgenomates bacterium]|nr:hypothetical protein [Candidatus Microgenomates bacterium]
MSTISGGRKGRKIGRNKAKCERYRLSHRREKNKIRKILKHLKKHPNNTAALRRIEELKRII